MCPPLSLSRPNLLWYNIAISFTALPLSSSISSTFSFAFPHTDPPSDSHDRIMHASLNIFLVRWHITTPVTQGSWYFKPCRPYFERWQSQSICFSCFFVTATASIPYSIYGLTMFLYIRSFIGTGTFLSHWTHVTFHSCPPVCSLLPTALFQLPYFSCLVIHSDVSNYLLFISVFPYPYTQSFPAHLHSSILQQRLPLNLVSISSLLSHGDSLLTSSVRLPQSTRTSNLSQIAIVHIYSYVFSVHSLESHTILDLVPLSYYFFSCIKTQCKFCCPSLNLRKCQRWHLSSFGQP